MSIGGRLAVMRTWVGLWAGSLLLVFAQGYFMSRQSWMLPTGIALALACLWIGWKWSRAVARRGAVAVNALRLVGILHVLPLLAQVLQIAAPRWDNLILAVIGWLLLECAGWPKARNTAPEVP